MDKKKVGRPKKEVKRDRILMLRLTDEEYERIFMKAKRNKMSMSEVMRNYIF